MLLSVLLALLPFLVMISSPEGAKWAALSPRVHDRTRANHERPDCPDWLCEADAQSSKFFPFFVVNMQSACDHCTLHLAVILDCRLYSV